MNIEGLAIMIVWLFGASLIILILKVKIGNWIVAWRLFKYAINPSRWDGRLHRTFVHCRELRRNPEILNCGCILTQERSGDHEWTLILDFINCRYHHCSDYCKEGVNE